VEELVRNAAHSRIITTNEMTENYEHLAGKIHCWVISSLVEKAAYECAFKHTDLPCTTVSIDSFIFHSPLNVGQNLTLFASVNFVNQNSVIVGIRGETEQKHICTAFLSMVPRNEQNRKNPIPKLVLQTTEDVRRYMEAKIRREASIFSEVTTEQRIAELNIFRALDQVRRDRNVVLGFELTEL